MDWSRVEPKVWILTIMFEVFVCSSTFPLLRMYATYACSYFAKEKKAAYDASSSKLWPKVISEIGLVALIGIFKKQKPRP